MRDIRDQPYRLPPELVPAKLVGSAVRCPECGLPIPVDWIGKMEFPKQPIAPHAGGGHWIPASIPVICTSPTCNSKEIQVQIPRTNNEGTWTLYGDEAARFVAKPLTHYSPNPLYFFCITLVGLHRKKHARVQKQIAMLKKQIAPDRDPEQWSHHFTDIWGSDGRDGEFKLPNKNAKIRYGRSFAKVIRDSRPELATFNISGCVRIPHTNEHAGHVKALNQKLFCLSVLTSLEQMRFHGKSVRWVYDNIKDATNGARTEGWAAEVFLGLQYTRLFSWLSSGTTVLPPEFVSPGSHYLLEVADFISYCVARDFDKSVQGAQNELPSSLLGQGFYQGILQDGSVDALWSRGLPLQRFFGVTT